MRNKQWILIAICFFLSGFAGLIYQAAWANYLGLVFGTSYLAVATVLAAYMFGLAVGGFLASIYLSRIKYPVRVYGFLEGGIALSALAVPLLIAIAQGFYFLIYGGQPVPVSAQGISQPVFFLMASFLILLVPTVAMGATLPLLARYIIKTSDDIGPSVGALYFINTLGAVMGVLVAGFALLPTLGVHATTLVAVATNGLIFVLIALNSKDFSTPIQTPPNNNSAPSWHPIYAVSMAIGIVSFSLEVYWTRLLSHIMGGTSFAFAIMLGSFLSGIAVGGGIGGYLAQGRYLSRRYLGFAVFLMAMATATTYLWLNWWSPPVGRPLLYKGLYAFCALFPSAVFLGATYPLAVRSASAEPSLAPAVGGRIYSWNTLGAIIGSLLTGFWLLPLMGFVNFLKAVVVASIFIGAYLLVSGDKKSRLSSIAPAFIILVAVLIVVTKIPEPSSILAAHLKNDDQQDYADAYVGVGKSATIMLHPETGFFRLASNGLSESAIGRLGMPPMQLSQKWLTGLPALARPSATDALVVGLGGGIALQGVPPSFTSIDVIELEPEVVRANQYVAKLRWKNPLIDPRVNLVINDARNALSLTDKRYDIIVSQPSHPWTGGAAHLYTREFLQLAKRRLVSDGVFLQWINSQFVDKSLLGVMAVTLLSEFAHVELYQPEPQVLMFLASNAPLDLWNGKMNAKMAFDQQPQHFLTLGMRAVDDVVAMLALDQNGVKQLAEGREVNTDDMNLLAYRSRPSGDGLKAPEVLGAVENGDPLLRKDFRDRSGSWSLPYITERLLQSDFLERVGELSKGVSDRAAAKVSEGLRHEYQYEIPLAENAFREALDIDPSNVDAALGLLRLNLGSFASRQISADLAALANRLEGPSRSTLEGWVYGSSGDFSKLRALDDRLAAVDRRSLFFPIAVKLRADWRLWFSLEESDPRPAIEAIELLDQLLASYWNADLYLLRAANAAAAHDAFVMVESYAAAINQIRGQLKLTRSAGREQLQQRLNFAYQSLRGHRSIYSRDPVAMERAREILQAQPI